MRDAVAYFAGRHGGGRLDAVFANAGVLFMGPDEMPTPEQKQAMIDVNVSGVVHTFDAALPFLRRAAPGAHAIAMASTSAEYGSPHHAIYGATRFFVRGYTEALALEHRRAGIQVCGVYVACVDTHMVTGANCRPRRAFADATSDRTRPRHAGTPSSRVRDGPLRSRRQPTDPARRRARLGRSSPARKESRPCSGRSS
jgi:NAD(P)-dependent dehydrogenase (short-subunit alcohol dehydrogenase family)